MMLRLYLASLLTLAMGLIVPATARAEGCSQDSLRGAYGFISSVKIVLPDSKDRAERKSIVAVVVYDGAGNVRLVGSVIEARGVRDILLGGTYQINDQCLGRVVLLNSKGQKSDSWRFVMVSGGVRLLTVSESSPNVRPFAQEKR